MLHCTPCDDDPGKDSTLLIASVLHKQTCIQCIIITKTNMHLCIEAGTKQV